ncbi:MAG: succinate--CoA ligase subunit alpha, partial [Actinomycetota bacterium]|nr:succinate--CoA ligase subunit alpha [Actinomycetota bacterium]
GQSTAVGIGGDPIIGTNFIEILEQFEKDPETQCAVMIGEIGGNAEQRAAEYVQNEMSIPVVAYVAGFTAPEGKTMGHAGAIVSGGESTAQAKSEALERAGIRSATNPSEVAQLVAEALDETS